jgi:hypothetical protein
MQRVVIAARSGAGLRSAMDLRGRLSNLPDPLKEPLGDP